MASHRSSSPSSEDSNEITENGSNKSTNIFRNDGSFLEMFKKMQNASQVSSNVNNKSSNLVQIKKEPVEEEATASKPVTFIGRRRGSKALPVGKVKKIKTNDDSSKSTTTDAWAKYLEEVKKYKETYCDSESKNRSLVK